MLHAQIEREERNEGIRLSTRTSMGAAHVERKQSKLSSGEEQPRCHLLAFSLSDVSPFSLHLSIFFFFCFFSSSSSCGQEAGVAAAAEAGVAAEAEAGAEAEADAIAIVMEWSSSAVFHGSRTAGPARSTARHPPPAVGPAQSQRGTRSPHSLQQHVC